MIDFPEGASYDKQRSILVVFDMLFNTIKEQNPEAAALLTFISILGPWKVPVTLMKQFNVKITQHNPDDKDTRALARVLNDHAILRLALDKLNKACIVKLERNAARSCESFALHRAIGDWCIKGLAQEKRGWIVQGALGLLAETLSSTKRYVTVFLDKSSIFLIGLSYYYFTNLRISYYSPSWEIEGKTIVRRYLAPIDHCITLIQNTVPDDDLTAPDGKFCSDYAEITSKVAHAYLYDGRFETATRYFNSAIEFDRIDQGDEWPSTERSLDLLGGLAVAYQKSGDLQNAAEIATTALEFSEKICDERDLRSTSLSSLLKNINERREIMLQHHKSMVIAAVDTKISLDAEHVASGQRSIPEGASFEEFDETANNYNYAEELRGACFAGDYGVVKLLLGLEEVKADATDPWHRTPLSWAAYNGHEAVVKLLLATGKVDADSKDSTGRTPLSRAAYSRHEAVVKLLLTTGKVDASSKDNHG
jgi:tetratricopeptide (TPR) repeat protein